MSHADRIADELDVVYSRWGLRGDPFSESASQLQLKQLDEVFTGREMELRRTLGVFTSIGRKRILVYGWFGIGKSAFLLEVLSVLERRRDRTLATYVSLPAGADLATAAFIALARRMEDDVWAQEQLNALGLAPRRAPRKRKDKLKAGITGFGGESEEETIPAGRLAYPAFAFEDLVARALKKHKRVVVAIDDLDKQDPARVRELLREAQGVLKGDAWFMLTGHPAGLTRDILTRELGLFDLALRLDPLDEATTYRALGKYLNSAREPDKRRDPDDPRAVWPFTPEAARALCVRSDGVPRWLNRLASYVLQKAVELRAERIDTDVLRAGFDHAAQVLRDESPLTPEDYYVLELILEKGVLSDDSVTMGELQGIRKREFDEVLPILEKLVQLDLVRRLPTERTAAYGASPLLAPDRDAKPRGFDKLPHR